MLHFVNGDGEFPRGAEAYEVSHSNLVKLPLVMLRAATGAECCEAFPQKQAIQRGQHHKCGPDARVAVGCSQN